MSLAPQISSPAGPPVSENAICHFDRLPQEILHKICDFAYGHPVESSFITKDQHMDLQLCKTKRGYSTSIRPFKPQVDRYMVSKRFFLSAIEAFVKAQHLDLSDGCEFTNAYIAEQKVFALFARSATLSSVALDFLQDFSALRHLTIKVDCDHFGKDEWAADKYPWLYALQDAEIAELPFVQSLSNVRGLKTFTCTYECCYYVSSPEELQLWEDNVLAIEKYLLPIVTTKKAGISPINSSNGIGPQPLYRGSRVSGIACGSSLLTTESDQFEALPKQTTQVLSMGLHELHRRVKRALREHPDLARPLD
ncbi:hypothetical protein CKM354_001225600 [Cercospora kikuchii]|uniref:Uncharacterized protein n=1 Tax=Cercospora kikuchii TaxID=84275 RepID=A0A9P3FLM6_9PEZI|nr:uncharacterized protein CKM354_001225600 [Cercospora kikuchii]GIZ49221.1 hypothetical protein CKM354_001225600 [Cercospora kikuchii]